jgi:hypothetical protein
MMVPAPRDYRLSPFDRLWRTMAVPGRQNGDAKLLLDLERKTKP